MLLVAMSERDSPRWREGMQGRAEGHSQPFLQVSRRPRRLANYAHGGKYSGRLRHATPPHVLQLLPPALPCPPSHCPFSGCRLNLLPSGISFRVQVEQLQEEALLRSGRKHFRNVTKQQIDKKKRARGEEARKQRVRKRNRKCGEKDAIHEIFGTVSLA